MIRFIKNPIVLCFAVLICDCVLSVPIILISSEKSIVFNIIFSILFIFSSYYINLLIKKSYEVVSLYTQKSFIILAVILFIAIEILSKVMKYCEFSLYILSLIFYCTTILISMLVLLFSFIAKQREKIYSKRLYQLAIVVLFFTTICSCITLFKTPEQWIK